MKRLVPAALAVIGMAVGMVAVANAQSVTPKPLSRPTTLCDNQTGLVYNRQHDAFILRTPHWRRIAGSMCVASTGHIPFKITKVPVTDGHVNSFPDLVTGCIQWVCTPNSKMPIRVRHIRTLRSTWWTRGGARGTWNAAFDVWLGKKPFNADGTSTRSGAELMVWLNYSESYAGNPIVRIDGRRWYFMHWRTCDRVRGGQHHHGGVPPADATCFNYISFRAVHRMVRVNNLNLKAFISWSTHYRHRHLIRSRWWVEDVGTGFELWSGGVGLGTTKFNVKLHKTVPRPRTTVRAVRTALNRAGFHHFVVRKPQGTARVIVTPRRSRLLPQYAKALRRHAFTVNRDPRHPRSRLLVS